MRGLRAACVLTQILENKSGKPAPTAFVVGSHLIFSTEYESRSAGVSIF